MNGRARLAQGVTARDMPLNGAFVAGGRCPGPCMSPTASDPRNGNGVLAHGHIDGGRRSSACLYVDGAETEWSGGCLKRTESCIRLRKQSASVLPDGHQIAETQVLAHCHHFLALGIRSRSDLRSSLFLLVPRFAQVSAVLRRNGGLSVSPPECRSKLRSLEVDLFLQRTSRRFTDSVTVS